MSAAASPSGRVRVELGGPGWTVHPAGKPADATPATVPSTVHTDLLAAGKIPDPYYRTNEADLQWIGTTAWVYERHFTVPADLLARRHVELRCDGLETLAHVLVNGKPVGDTADMFRTYRFDVRSLLHAGDNTIAVTFDPLKPYLKAKMATSLGRLRAIAGMGGVRVEPCSDGWDFGPKFITAGIWRPIGIDAWDGGRIATVAVDEDLADPKTARLSVDVTADADGTVPLAATATVSFAGRVIATAETKLTDGDGRLPLNVPDPHLWWPNGMGDQPLYDVAVSLATAGKPIDRRTKRIGLRTVALQPPTADHALRLAVNGRPIFAKGANWIPCDMFPTRVTTARLRGLVADAKRANMNILRCWGGGYYEEDGFYDACDEMGLLVWGEFKFACSAYPVNDPAFMADVAAEARDQVLRLRHHPSLAVWCGNNEVLSVIHTYGLMIEAEYALLFHDLLGGVVRQLSPRTPFVGGSPEAGDEHNWWVWHVGQPFEKYLDGHGWMTEFGFQSFPEPRTVATFTEPADRTSPRSPVMVFHQRNGNGRGNPMIVEMMGRYFRPAKDFDSAMWLSQINQAMGVTLGVRHWRADWPRSSGALVWQLNEIWTGPTWSCVDYYGRWKAVMYRLRHANAPVVIDAHADPHGGTVTVDVATDSDHPINATLDWTLTDLAGSVVGHGTAPVAVPAGTSAARAWSHPFDAQLERLGRRHAMLWLTLTDDGRTLSTQTVLFAKPKRLDLADPHLTLATRKTGDGYDVTITAEHPALYAWVDAGADARYSDNFVDVGPGHPTTVHVTTTAAADTFAVRSLFDTYAPVPAEQPVAQAVDGTITATAATADVVGDSPVVEAGSPPNVGQWSDPRDSLQWVIHVDRPGTFRGAAAVAWPGRGGPDRGFTVAVGGQRQSAAVPRTESWSDYRPAALGTFTIATAGNAVVTLRPETRAADGGGFMNFRALTLTPVSETP